MTLDSGGEGSDLAIRIVERSVAHTGQSPGSGLGFLVNILENFGVVPSSLGVAVSCKDFCIRIRDLQAPPPTAAQ